MEAHLAMAAADKVRQGMTPARARAEARRELGGLTELRETSRAARGLPWLDTFWLDIKLGLRMLRKSWGLTLIGGLAMTIAIFIGVAVFMAFDLAYGGTLPLEDGARVVALQTWDDTTHRRVETSMLDFERWSDGLRSVTDIGAFREIERNLLIVEANAGTETSVVASGKAEPVKLVEMTASGFELARVSPLLGRTLAREDERSDAVPVVVIGHELWRSRFLGDSAVVGRDLRLGDTVHTIVGVMPEGFAFPVDHQLWTALEDSPSGYLPPAPKATVFARLAPGATIESAETELATLGLLPTTIAFHQQRQRGRHEADSEIALRPRVMSYTFAFTGDRDRSQVMWIVRIVLALVTLLLVPPCANVAILVYARTITRHEEFAARHTLGASRGRIVGQLYIEMLVLAMAAAGVALVALQLFVRYAETALFTHPSDTIPFWFDFNVTLRTALFAFGLALVAATIAGLVPALKATGRQMRSGLHALGNRTGNKLGKTWTALVVGQVALSLAALPSAIELGWGTIRDGILGPGFAAEAYLTARLTLNRDLLADAIEGSNESADERASDHTGKHTDDSRFVSRFADLQAELIRALASEPGVTGVTVAGIPGDEPWKRVEVEPLATSDALGETEIPPSRGLVRINRVDDAFLEVYDIPLLAGRALIPADFGPGSNPVIVNRTFADQLLGDANPLGRRLRQLPSNEDDRADSAIWNEIVGVVADRPANATRGTIYLPASAGLIHPATVSLRAATDAAGLSDRLREIATGRHPALQLDEVLTLDSVYRDQQIGNSFGAISLAAITLSVLLLSAAGLYALLSFTVNQRRREIGIRAALGAQPRRLLASVFRRALRQFAVGTAIGVAVALALSHYLPAEVVGGWRVPGVIPAAAGFMMMIGLLAALGPARRGLKVEPIEELRNG